VFSAILQFKVEIKPAADILRIWASSLIASFCIGVEDAGFEASVCTFL